MGVNHVQLGNGETVVDLRDVTVSEDVLLEGYTAIDSKGNPVVGKASPNGGGEEVKEIAYIGAVFDLSTLTCTYSGTFSELKSLYEEGKYIVGRILVSNNVVFFMTLSDYTFDSIFVFSGIMQANLPQAGGLVVLQISFEITSKEEQNTRVRLVSVTNLN